MNQDIQKILDISVNAPSGSNSQPWRFEVQDNKIWVFALPEKDHPILNFRNRGTLVAEGALIENIRVVSESMGYEPVINLSSDRLGNNLIAEIILKKSTLSKDNELASAVNLRTTNRKPYKCVSLTTEQKESLLASAGEVGGGNLLFVEDENDLRVLGSASSVNEIIMLEDRQLHKLFFDEICWDNKEEELRKSGLYLKTMELKPPQQLALKILRHWPIMKLFNKVHVARLIAGDNAKNYSTCSAIGAVVINDSDQEFIQAGRLLERVWLKATSMGLSLHLLTGTLFLWQNVKAGKKHELSDEHVKLIKNAYNEIASVFNIGNDKLVGLLFRIGYGEEPSARSIKVSPDIKYI